MLPTSAVYWIVIGAAVFLGALYFYCTMKNQRCYTEEEAEAENNQREIN